MNIPRKYTFEDRLEVERTGAAILDGIFGSEYIIVQATRAHQKKKVDRFFIHRKDVLVHVVDYKIDERAGETGNLFFEHVSVSQNGKVKANGWLFTTPADLLVYYVPKHDIAHVLKTQSIRDAWKDILLCFEPKEVRTVESGIIKESYSTFGVPVPIIWLKGSGLIYASYSAIGAQMRLTLRV